MRPAEPRDAKVVSRRDLVFVGAPRAFVAQGPNNDALLKSVESEVRRTRDEVAPAPDPPLHGQVVALEPPCVGRDQRASLVARERFGSIARSERHSGAGARGGPRGSRVLQRTPTRVRALRARSERGTI